MGHYWREMDPRGAAEHDRRIVREANLREKLENVTLDRFTVGELEALMRLLGLARNTSGTLEPREEDLKILEKKIRAKKCKGKR